MYLDWNKCYELTLSWTWPDNEPDGEILWNLYRVEAKPEEVDVRFIEPIATGLRNVPGEKGTFLQNGTDFDGIAPYRTYYYILTPMDQVGNEQTLVSYPSQNVERVYIEDEYWQYNQHLIPEPPAPEEPPYGVEWLGELEEYYCRKLPNCWFRIANYCPNQFHWSAYHFEEEKSTQESDCKTQGQSTCRLR